MIQIIDNFYTNPSSVLELAIDTFNTGGCSSNSVRSLPLNEIDPTFYNEFCDIICSMYNINRKGVDIYTFISEQTYDGISQGMPHIDGRSPSGVSNYETYNIIAAGQIFLSEKYDPDSGITIYKNNYQGSDREKFEFAINSCYKEKNSLSRESYVEHLMNYLNNFEVDINIKNRYNRFVSWNGGTVHCSQMTKLQHSKIVQSFYISVV